MKEFRQDYYKILSYKFVDKCFSKVHKDLIEKYYLMEKNYYTIASYGRFDPEEPNGMSKVFLNHENEVS